MPRLNHPSTSRPATANLRLQPSSIIGIHLLQIIIRFALHSKQAIGFALAWFLSSPTWIQGMQTTWTSVIFEASRHLQPSKRLRLEFPPFLGNAVAAALDITMQHDLSIERIILLGLQNMEGLAADSAVVIFNLAFYFRPKVVSGLSNLHDPHQSSMSRIPPLIPT